MNNSKRKQFLNEYAEMLLSTIFFDKEMREKTQKEWALNKKNFYPTKLYKYRECNNQNFETLKRNNIWFSNPNNWNDKIDFTAKYNTKQDVHDLNIIRNNLADIAYHFLNLYLIEIKQNKNGISRESCKRIVEKLFVIQDSGGILFDNELLINGLKHYFSDEELRMILDVMNKLATGGIDAQNIQAGFKKLYSVNDIKSKIFMCSFSETYNNNHQWAIYGNNNSGFCIEYSVDELNDYLLSNLIPVYYGKRRNINIIDLLWKHFCNSDNDYRDALSSAAKDILVSLLTKDITWRAEAEWRIFQNATNSIGAEVNIGCATAIYLGCDIQDEDKQKLIKIAKENGLKVYQQQLNGFGSDYLYKQIKI